MYDEAREVRTLFEYNRWANARFLEVMATLGKIISFLRSSRGEPI